MGLLLKRRKAKTTLPKKDEKKKGQKGRPKGISSPITKRAISYRGKEKIATQGEEKPIQVTNVFDRIRAAKTPIVVVYGGSRSSKSHSIIQDLTDRFFTIPNRQILTLRKTLPSLRMTTYKDFYRYIAKINLWPYVKERKMMMEWDYQDAMIHFGSLVDPERIRSSEFNDIWMEEATEFSWEDFCTLRTRMSANPGGVPNRIYLSFNPIFQRHWIKERLIDTDPDVTVVHSTYKDNPFLSPDYVKLLEGLEAQDPNYWRIFGLGMWGALQNIIYTNWRPIGKDELFRFNREAEEIYGLDFGYSQNESALLQIFVDGYNCSMEQKIYERGLTTPKLIERMREEIPPKKRDTCPIYADNAEPDRIAEINEAGFWCIPCYKGQVKYGIDFVKRYSIFVDAESTDLLKEIKSYVWKKDKAENILDEPVKFADHLMDAGRYALLTHGIQEMGGSPTVRSFGIKEDDVSDDEDDDEMFALEEEYG